MDSPAVPPGGHAGAWRGQGFVQGGRNIPVGSGGGNGGSGSGSDFSEEEEEEDGGRHRERTSGANVGEGGGFVPSCCCALGKSFEILELRQQQRFTMSLNLYQVFIYLHTTLVATPL